MAAMYRKRFNFWLNILDDSDMAVAEHIQFLKNERSFTQSIRDGIRLVMDLRQGRVDVLKELFPDIVTKLSSNATPPTSGGGDWRREIEMLKQAVLSQADGLINTPTNGAPKTMQVPAFRTPTFDDLGKDDIVLKKDTSTDSAKNFLNSMMALQG